MKLKLAAFRMIQDRLIPGECRPAGWAALNAALSLEAPLRHRCCVAERHVRGSRRTEGEWQRFDKRYWPGETFADHLTFALRHEPLDLLLLVRILKAVPASVIRDYVRSAPTGRPNRRVWYFAEHLVGTRLELPDAEPAAAVDLLDPERYFTGSPRLSKRHRVRDNLLGVPGFCGESTAVSSTTCLPNGSSHRRA